MSDHVTVKFTKNYIASRGPGITGAKGSERSFRMTASLQALLDDGTVELVKGTPASKRSKATKKTAEKS